MDIKEALNRMNSSDNFGDEVISELSEKIRELSKKIRAIERQKEELDKTMHILRVVFFADKIEELVNTDLFSKDNITKLKVNNVYNSNPGVDETRYDLVNENGEIVSSYDYVEGEQGKILELIFSELAGLNVAFLNPNLRVKKMVSLSLKPGIKENLLKLFLNEDIKKEYEYGLMDLELPNSNNNGSKPFKV